VAENQKLAPHFLGHRKRLRAKFLQNAQGLADYEVLELILGYVLPRKDTKPLAKELLKRFGNFKTILLSPKEDLLSIAGIGESVYCFLELLREFWFRSQEQEFREQALAVTNPGQVFSLFREKLAGLDKEEFWLILLNAKNKIQSLEQVSKGTVDRAPVYLREVIAMVLQKKAVSFIVVHNHPSGDPTPSCADKNLTNTLAELSQKLDINFLDHVIIGKNRYYSFKDENLL